MNVLPQEKIDLIEHLSRGGATVREVSRLVGANRNTVQRYRKAYVDDCTCPCGKPLKHRVWCSFRYAKSPARQLTMQQLHARQRTVALTSRDGK